ncbi:MAG: hypothetical protein ACNA8L_11810 [Luteolibacter sp.]|jgi:HlyD family secretion protein
MKRIFAPAFAALFASLPTAGIANEGELTIQPSEFIIHESFTATALPSSAQKISIAAESWTTFEITQLANHGTSVKKGGVLITFASEELDKAIADLEKTVERRELEISAARLELVALRETAEDRLAVSRRSAEQAEENHRYYNETRHAIDVESAEQAVLRAEQRLRNANEELVQLKRMYEADDLVEETEEIILSRAREAVEAAEFALRVEKIDQKRRIETNLPRHLESLLDAKKETAHKLVNDEAEIPRAITLKQIDLARLEVTQQRDIENLTKLQADRGLLEITAPADGMFYYGEIENGEWTAPAELMRTLVIAGRPPVKRLLATFIPADTKLDFHAILPEATARSFGGEKSKGLATLTGRGDISIPVTLTSVASVPSPTQQHHAIFAAEWPKDIRPVPGATAKIHVITYAREGAVVVPAKALAFGSKGWQVELKLADGKTEKRPVTRGRANGDKVEILKGLESGQVIVLP